MVGKKDIKRFVKKFSLLAVLFSFFITACGDSDGGANTSTNAGTAALDEVYASEDDLPGCIEKYDGAVAFVKEGSTAFKCEDGRWENKGEYYANNEAIKNCTAKREGEVAYIVDEDKSLVCEDGKWVNSSDVSSSSSWSEVKGSSSSIASSSSWTPEGGVESSSAQASSSSSAEESSSSVASSRSLQSSSSIVVAMPCKTDEEDNCEYGILKDPRDGQEYKTVKIGEQWWMAQNLNYAYTGVPFDNGPYTSDSTSWCYDNVPANCAKYGRLYTWAAAMDSVGTWSANGKGCGYGKECSATSPVRGVCPKGWHLPSNDEWKALIVAVAGSITEYTSPNRAGAKLKSATGWKAYSGITNEDAFGFSALPAGYRYFTGSYDIEGNFAGFWSCTEDGSNGASEMNLYYNDANAPLYGKRHKSSAYSVRCLKD